MDKQQIEAIRKRMPSYDRPGKSELLTPYGTAMQDATALLKAYDALAARLAVEEAHGEKYQRELAELRARLAEAERDALRYRFLRDAPMSLRNKLDHYAGPALDEAIDALPAPDSASGEGEK